MREMGRVIAIVAVAVSSAVLMVGCTGGVSKNFRTEALTAYDELDRGVESCNLSSIDRARAVNRLAVSTGEKKVAVALLDMGIARTEYCIEKMSKRNTDRAMDAYLQAKHQVKSLL